MFFCNFAGKNLLEFDGNHSGVYTAVAGETPAGPAVPFWRHQDVHDRQREGGAGYGRAASFSMSAMGRPVISAMSVIDDNDF